MADLRAEARVLATDTPASFETAVRQAAELLKAGELVALPTETVYGLAANALDAGAVRKIFSAKGRPAHNPVIVHVASVAMARDCVAAWPPVAAQLAAAFWPGPLTLVLPRSPIIPDLVTAGGPTVGVRWPSHPLIQAVIHECGFPLAAPSANLSSRTSPTTAEHVRRCLGRKIRLIVDGGHSQVGIESTVVDVSVTPPQVLRPGMIHAESLLAVLAESGMDLVADGTDRAGHPRRSPGRLPRHYSPKARLVVWSWTDAADLRAQLSAANFPAASCQVIAHTRIPAQSGIGQVRVMPRDPAAFARALYAELHQCDEEGARVVVVEALPEGAAWQAIADRLRRASA